MNPQYSTPNQNGDNPETCSTEDVLFRKIASLLMAKNISYTVLQHDEIEGSAAEASSVTDTRPEQGAKALIMMSNGKTPLMVVLRGPDMADIRALKRAIGTKDLRLATLEEVHEMTGTEIGVIPAIGNLFGMETYCDEDLIYEGDIAFGTGLHTKTIMINAEDYLQVASPTVGKYSKR